jgi:hypothetical protein
VARNSYFRIAFPQAAVANPCLTCSGDASE